MNKCSHATVEYTGQRFFEGAEFVRCQSCGENMIVDLCDYKGIGHGLYSMAIGIIQNKQKNIRNERGGKIDRRAKLAYGFRTHDP